MGWGTTRRLLSCVAATAVVAALGAACEAEDDVSVFDDTATVRSTTTDVPTDARVGSDRERITTDEKPNREPSKKPAKKSELQPGSSVPANEKDREATADRETAVAVLNTLAVKGRAPMTGYDRDRFGPAWLDANRNGCDTRNDMLNLHLANIVHEAGTGGCKVLEGVLADRYTGRTIEFVYGHGSLVDIDHVVALGNGWVTGASAWGIAKRAGFANDPLNLVPSDAGENRSKGDGDAATWLPPNTDFRCDYVARQVAVKHKYHLWVTSPEKAAMHRVLDRCPGQPLVEDSGAAVTVDHNITDPGPQKTAPTPKPQQPRPATAAASNCSTGYNPCVPSYPPDVNCADVDGPIRVTGHDPHGLDGDGDGIACE